MGLGWVVKEVGKEDGYRYEFEMVNCACLLAVLDLLCREISSRPDVGGDDDYDDDDDGCDQDHHTVIEVQ